ncbi:MAG: ATP-grasp domain-containing protein [Ignavibacteria bacterium]|nr:ATP-grasp domain-containing protein [Ignavibacteria bacterium]
MNSSNPVGAVIIGSDFQALGAIRSLSEKNVPVFLIEHELGISKFSRFVNRRAKDYSLLSSDSFTDRLIKIAEKENLKDWVLYPNNDEIIKLISINRDKLKDWYKIPVPSWDIVKNFYYKQNAYRIAKNLSIPIPRIYKNGSIEQLLDNDYQFPVILKPACKEDYYPIMKKKAIKINNRSELVSEYKKMTSIIDSSNIVIQDMIEGGPNKLFSYVTFFDGKKCVAGMSANRLRQHPMDFGHATTYAESVELPEIADMAEKLLKEMNYFGIAEVEFMKDDKENEYKFLEINGRIWGWHTLAKAAGINLPYLIFQHMIGEKINAGKPIEDVKWIRLITDIPTVLKELLSGRMNLKEYLKTIRGKKEYAVFSFRDPLPFFMELLLMPYFWIKRGF